MLLYFRMDAFDDLVVHALIPDSRGSTFDRSGDLFYELRNALNNRFGVEVRADGKALSDSKQYLVNPDDVVGWAAPR